MASLTDLFLGNPKWGRPTHGANRFAVLAGTSGCFCAPPTATRVVVEMWGQGGGGPGACCCQWDRMGGQGGSYAYKVWDGALSPSSTGQGMSFCGCVCACDCMSCSEAGHPGQFSRLRNCNTLGGTGIGSWLGCVTGGAGGCALCTATTWMCFGCCTNCNAGYDICCITRPRAAIPDFYSIAACMSEAQSSGCRGGSQQCCAGASCYCAGNLCSFTCTGQQHIFNDIVPVGAGGTDAFTFDQIFAPVSCACFDTYRLGACGWSKNQVQGLTGCTTWNYCWIGVGGAAYAGGRQENRSFSNGNYAYCGYGGNFPGGGAKGAGACGGGCCSGGIGGGGLILISWS